MAAPQPPGAPLRLPKTAELVADDLRRRIIRGEFAAGEALPSESALMEHFGVSRPSMREAFRVLESESLISVRRGARGGARVQPPRPEVAARYVGLILQYQGTPLSDVYAVRALLEPPCAAALARRHTAADLAALRVALESSGADDDPGGAVAAYHDFHAVLIERAGNQTLVLLDRLVREIIAQANTLRARQDPTAFREASRSTMTTHRRLVDLIASGDADGAESLWRRHLREGARYALGDEAADAGLDILR
jgi:DNA-binding FadR family transcriptional regulator